MNQYTIDAIADELSAGVLSKPYEHKGMLVRDVEMATYGPHGGYGAVGQANYEYLQRRYGMMSACVIDRDALGHRMVAFKCGVPMDDNDFSDLRDDLYGLQYYPSLDDDRASEVEDEWRVEAWDGWLKDDVARLFEQEFANLNEFHFWLQDESALLVGETGRRVDTTEYESYTYDSYYLDVEAIHAKMVGLGWKKREMLTDPADVVTGVMSGHDLNWDYIGMESVCPTCERQIEELQEELAQMVADGDENAPDEYDWLDVQCEGHDLLIGDWVKGEDGLWAVDYNGPNGFALIYDSNMNVAQVLWSRMSRWTEWCSPCYPGQGNVEEECKLTTEQRPDWRKVAAYSLPISDEEWQLFDEIMRARESNAQGE